MASASIFIDINRWIIYITKDGAGIHLFWYQQMNFYNNNSFIDINKCFIDINKTFIDINKWFIDIYKWRRHSSLFISINELLISIKLAQTSICIDINKWMFDINNSFTNIIKYFIYINKWIVDINKDGAGIHLYWLINLLISINHLLISIKMDADAIFIYINKWFIDINNSAANVLDVNTGWSLGNATTEQQYIFILLCMQLGSRKQIIGPSG